MRGWRGRHSARRPRALLVARPRECGGRNWRRRSRLAWWGRGCFGDFGEPVEDGLLGGSFVVFVGVFPSVPEGDDFFMVGVADDDAGRVDGAEEIELIGGEIDDAADVGVADLGLAHEIEGAGFIVEEAKETHSEDEAARGFSEDVEDEQAGVGAVVVFAAVVDAGAERLGVRLRRIQIVVLV